MKSHFAHATLYVMIKLGLLEPYVAVIDGLLNWLCEVNGIAEEDR